MMISSDRDPLNIPHGESLYFMLQVLHTAAKEMLNYQGLGYGVMGKNALITNLTKLWYRLDGQKVQKTGAMGLRLG